MKNIVKDLSTLTTIEEENLNKLVEKELWCICSYVEEMINSKENFCDIDLGIGTLTISIMDNQLKFKFIPSQTLEQGVRDTIVNEKSPLRLSLEKSLVNKISNIYKELI